MMYTTYHSEYYPAFSQNEISILKCRIQHAMTHDTKPVHDEVYEYIRVDYLGILGIFMSV